ncbi:MAG: sugar transferase [Candidatus Krumholzibacteria bacterium]|nr:sugar transferase [Candidatus Krumholzibacteria bacterium]
MNRLLDCLLSAVCLVVGLIPMAIIAMLISLGDGGPVFFSQTRIGRHSRPFRLLKFRTMKRGSEADFTASPRDDARVTPLGRWLRRHRLDELPQLLNVLRGDMSLIGPRPEVPRYYSPAFARLSHVRPGLVDSATLRWLDEERLLRTVDDPESFYRDVILPDKLARSHADIEARSFTHDLGLLLGAARSVLRRRGEQTRFEQSRPYRGTWSFPWIARRYFRSSLSGFTPRRAANLALAVTEMALARPLVRSRPFVLRIEPSNACTLRCPNCACGTHTDPREKGLLAMEDLRYALEQTAGSVVAVRLDGMGEPTMHPQIFEMIRLIKSHGMSVSMSTSLDPPSCDRIDAFIDSGLDRLVVSMDGATQAVYEQYRVGGRLENVQRRVTRLARRKRVRRARNPLIEVQFLDLDHNRHEIGDTRRLAREWGADKFTVTGADPTIKAAQFPKNPKRCLWLWCVVTLAWNLDYRSCTNAWSLPWPALNMRDTPLDAYWNHPHLREARVFNKDKSSAYITNAKGCKCNRCYEMLVAPMEGDYFCE